jgi:hypothetical protein
MKPLGVSVGLEWRGAEKTDVIGTAAAPTATAEQHVGFCTAQVVLSLRYTG